MICRHYAVSLEAGNGCQGYEMNTNFSLFQCSMTLTVSIDYCVIVMVTVYNIRIKDMITSLK